MTNGKMARVVIYAKGYMGLHGTVTGMQMTITGPVMLVAIDPKQGHPARTVAFVAYMLQVEKPNV